MALARARFRPSTVISTLVPRAMPSGWTVSRVGGVVRFPVERTVLSAAQAAGASAAHAANPRALFRSHLVMIHLVNFQCSIKQAGGEALAVRREFQSKGPIRLLRHGADLRQVHGLKEADGAIGRG